jgi:hypothetical protein
MTDLAGARWRAIDTYTRFLKATYQSPTSGFILDDFVTRVQ